MVIKKGYAMLNMSQIERDIAVHKSHCFVNIMDEEYGCKYGPDNECPANQNLRDVINGLSPVERSVLKDLTEIGYDWYQGYSAINFRDFSTEEVKKAIYKLKLLGLIEFSRGLMFEDEYRTAGSGWRVVRKNTVIEEMERQATFDEVLNDVRLFDQEDRVKLKAAHERELDNCK